MGSSHFALSLNSVLKSFSVDPHTGTSLTCFIYLILHPSLSEDHLGLGLFLPEFTFFHRAASTSRVNSGFLWSQIRNNQSIFPFFC